MQVDRVQSYWTLGSRPTAVHRAPMFGMTSSTLSLALAALATSALVARAVAPVAREIRNCVLLWLALRGTKPGQRPEVLKALPSLDRQPSPASVACNQPAEVPESEPMRFQSTQIDGTQDGATRPVIPE